MPTGAMQPMLDRRAVRTYPLGSRWPKGSAMDKVLNLLNVTVGCAAHPIRSLRSGPVLPRDAEPLRFSRRHSAGSGLAIHRTIRLPIALQRRSFLRFSTSAEQVAVWLDGRRQDEMTRDGHRIRVRLADVRQGRPHRLVVGLLGGQAIPSGPIVLEQSIDICYTQEYTEPLESGGRYFAAAADDALPGRFDTRRILDLAGLPFRVAGWSDVLPAPVRMGPCDAVPYEIVNLPPRRSWRIGCRADHLYLLGMVSTYDAGTGSWYRKGPDTSMEQFIGDRLGRLRIRYVGGRVQTVPLIFGFTLLYFGPLRGVTGGGVEQAAPFDEPAARRDLRRCLYLHEGYPQESLAYVLKIKPAVGSAIRSMEVEGYERFLGRPVVSAVTVETTSPSESLLPLPPLPGAPRRLKTLTASDVEPSRVQQCIRRVQSRIFTFAEDIKPHYKLDVPEGFHGPRVRFEGDGFADMLTNIYHHSLVATGLMVADDGTSTVVTDALPNWGSYRHAMGAFRRPRAKEFPETFKLGSTTWSRDVGRAVHELVRFGRHAKADAAVKVFDANIHLCDPPHWTRYWADACTKLFMETIDGSTYRGLPENNGHGLVMLARFRTWHALGRPAAWARRHWATTAQAAEWIVWQLEHPTMRDQPHGTIYISEEVGAGWNDPYTNSVCQAALRASAQMAEALGKKVQAGRWRRYADLMARSALKHLVEPDPPRRWTCIRTDDRYQRYSDWGTYCQSLGPAIMHADVFGFELAGLGAEAITASRNSLMQRLGEAVPPYYFAGPMGYGQAFITQAALLLDEMRHATELLKALAKYVYHPTYMPWIVPEGTACHPSGRYWYRQGMFANQVQIAEVLKTIAVVLGVDDVDLSVLRLMPRLPRAWPAASVREFPVTILSEGAPRQAALNYSYRRTARKCGLCLELDRPADRVVVRMGPFDAKPDPKATVNGRRVKARSLHSGDGWWVQMDHLAGCKFDISLAS